MSQTLTNVGQQVDLQMRQGADFGPVTLTFTNPNGSPVNLAGVTLVAQIRKNIADTTPIVAFTFVITNAGGGIATMKLTAAQTAAMTAGSTLVDAAGSYVWDLEFIDAGGLVSSPMYGNVQVFREVTR